MFTKNPKVRLGLRTIVQAKHGDDVALKLGRQIDASFTNPIACAVDRFLRQRNAEGALEIGDGSGELHGTASRCRRAGLDGEAKLFGKAPNQLHGGGIGRMACVELGASEALFAPDLRGFERLLAPDDDRYGNAASRGRGLFVTRLREQAFLAAGQYAAALRGEMRNGFRSHLDPPL
ncbi:MAG TPA: hypothetical protein VK635_05905 [Bradyrhizobium sp.]|nr:hypothetical protein [Bradyrhizobium sp.]